MTTMTTLPILKMQKGVGASYDRLDEILASKGTPEAEKGAKA